MLHVRCLLQTTNVGILGGLVVLRGYTNVPGIAVYCLQNGWYNTEVIVNQRAIALGLSITLITFI